MAEPTFPDFTLLPADYTDVDPDVELQQLNDLADATVAGTLDPATVTVKQPLGTSWAFDVDTGQLIKYGGTPAQVVGLDAVITWAMIALHTERFSSPIFDDQFGMDSPDRMIGFADTAQGRAHYIADVKAALQVHERITDVKDFQFATDPNDDEILYMTCSVIVDDESSVLVQAKAL